MYDTYGKTLEGAAKAYLAFNKGIIDAVYDLVPAVKPQVAMYEQLGAAEFKVISIPFVMQKKKDSLLLGTLNEVISLQQLNLMQKDILDW
jgi:orotidine-5'-phosphate decarboxylase